MRQMKLNRKLILFSLSTVVFVKAVAEMDKVTQQTAAGAEESASATQTLNSQTVEMDRVVRVLVSLVGTKGKGEEQVSREAMNRVRDAGRSSIRSGKPAPATGQSLIVARPERLRLASPRTHFP
jgi:hypothetical protein